MMSNEFLERKIAKELEKQIADLPDQHFVLDIKQLGLPATERKSRSTFLRYGLAASVMFILSAALLLPVYRNHEQNTHLQSLIAESQYYETLLSESGSAPVNIAYFQTLSEIETIDSQLIELYSNKSETAPLIKAWEERVLHLKIAVQIKQDNSTSTST